MPEAIRLGMSKAAEAVVDKGIHEEFSKWVACEGHQKAIAVGESVEQDTQQSYTRYFEALGKTKSLAQWRAKALALGVPSEGCLATRCVSDVGRMLLLKWATTYEERECLISADAKPVQHFCNKEAMEWLAN